MVGLPANQSNINFVAGAVARDLQRVMLRIEEFKRYLDATPDADLVNLGFTSGEVAILKSAFADAGQLEDLYRGAANLAAAKDFRVFLKLLWGPSSLD